MHYAVGTGAVIGYNQEHIKEGAANSQWFGQTILYRKST